MNILLTGYTGNIGAALARQLAHHRIAAVVRNPSGAPELPNVTVYPGDLENLPPVRHEIDAIVHCAARTAFRDPPGVLRRDNVAGTASILEFAARCPQLRKVVHISTTCVSGFREGEMPEERIPRPERFVNDYEMTKWEAEELVFESGLPAEVVRLSVVAGSACDGSVRRPGAAHRMLYWLWKGLVPMVPGDRNARVDLIDTEFAVSVIASCVDAPVEPGRVIHACAGEAAPSPEELLEALPGVFAESSPAWRSGGIATPAVVDEVTWGLFERSVAQSGDALFLRILRDASTFLPALLLQRRYAHVNASTLTSARPANWRSLLQKVSRHVTGPGS